jgi:hypothetical protein
MIEMLIASGKLLFPLGRTEKCYSGVIAKLARFNQFVPDSCISLSNKQLALPFRETSISFFELGANWKHNISF